MRDRGYTLIELLVVMTIISILSAVAVPNLLNAINRSRQKKTMADMRALCEGIEMYNHDHSYFPALDGVQAASLEADLGLYLGRFSVRDGWNRPFWYSSDGQHYTLRSLGSDGASDGPMSPGPIRFFADDIVYSDGALVRWPEGVQRQPPGGAT